MTSDRPGAGDDLSRWVGDPSFVQRVFDQMPLLVCAMEGPELRLAAATALYRAFSGRGDMVGRLAPEAFAEVAGQQVFQIFEHAYESGQPASLREFRVHADQPETGEQVELFLDFNVNPLFGEAEDIIGLIIDVVDVTEQVRQRWAAQRRAVEAERRYEQARDVVEALQRELLPAAVPVLPGLEIAASYLLADADTAAGGDWFDAVPLADGRVALVVGDVVGHGVAASAAMGQLRVVLHEGLVGNPDLPAALTLVDAAAGRIRGARAATVCVVVLDPATGALEYCTAGHLPPLVVSTTSGQARYLVTTGARPIGVGDGPGFTADSIAADHLADDELVLLYTDGILERPGRETAQSTVELSQAAGDIAADRALRDPASSPVDRVCTQTLELLVRVTGHSDDITLLAGHRVRPPTDLNLALPAVPESLVQLRDGLGAWMPAARVMGRDADVLRLAAVELATNAIEHAYVGSVAPGTYTVAVCLTATGQVRVEVSDCGRWRPRAPSQDRGLGLHVVGLLVDTLTVAHGDHGTTTVVTFRLGAPAWLLSPGEPTWTAPVKPSMHTEPVLVLDQPSAPSPRIRVDGPVDSHTVAEVERAVGRAGVTGTRTLTVDLTGVTHLASAGVAALYRLVALHSENGTALRLYAPAGTPADMVLSLVRLDHTTLDPDYPEPADWPS